MPQDSITLITEVMPPLATAIFPLTLVTNYEQDSPTDNLGPLTDLVNLIRLEYLVVSPTSAETIIALNPMLNATICATAFGLATTVHKRTAIYIKKLAKAKQKIH